MPNTRQLSPGGNAMMLCCLFHNISWSQSCWSHPVVHPGASTVKWSSRDFLGAEGTNSLFFPYRSWGFCEVLKTRTDELLRLSLEADSDGILHVGSHGWPQWKQREETSEKGAAPPKSRVPWFRASAERPERTTLLCVHMNAHRSNMKLPYLP